MVFYKQETIDRLGVIYICKEVRMIESDRIYIMLRWNRLESRYR